MLARCCWKVQPFLYQAAPMQGGSMHKLLISSLDNERVKEVVHLRDRHHRDKLGLFLIEGYREILRAVEGGIAFERIFISPELFLGENEPELISRCNTKVLETTPKVFQKMSYRDRPDGL